MRPFPSLPRFDPHAASSEGSLLFGEALDPAQLPVKESGRLCPALDPFQSTTGDGIMVSIFTV